MTIYLIIYTILFLSIFFEKDDVGVDTKRKVLISLVILFTLFRGLRWGVGSDWQQYYHVFLSASWDTIFSFNRYGAGEDRLEFGYVLLNTLIKSLGGDYTLFLLLTNAFILFSYYKFSIAFPKIAITTFIIIVGLSTFFPVRQNLAVAIVLFAYQPLINRSFLKFISIIILASFIHTSALTFSVVYFLFQFRIPVALAISMYIVTLVFSNPAIQEKIVTFAISHFAFAGDMVLLRAQTYMTAEKNTEVIGGGLFTNLLVVIYLVVFDFFRSRAPFVPNVAYNAFYNVFLFSKIIEDFFRYSMRHLQRLAEYYYFGYPVLLAIVITSVKDKYKPFVYFLFIAYMYYRFFQILDNFYPKLHIPYKSVF